MLVIGSLNPKPSNYGKGFFGFPNFSCKGLQLESVRCFLGMRSLVRALYGGFTKLGVPFWGSPFQGNVVYWGPYGWDSLILGNYHVKDLRGVLEGPGCSHFFCRIALGV